MSEHLPTTLDDGTPAAWVRIGSHRARAKVERVIGHEPMGRVTLCSSKGERIFGTWLYAVPASRLAEVCAIKSVAPVKRPPPGPWYSGW